MNFWQLVAELGLPIAATVGLGAFIMVIINYILGGIVSQIKFIERYYDIVEVNIPTIEKIGGGSVRCMLLELF